MEDRFILAVSQFQALFNLTHFGLQHQQKMQLDDLFLLTRALTDVIKHDAALQWRLCDSVAGQV